MKKLICVLVGLSVWGSIAAIGRSDVRAIIEEAYPGAIITEIERETYKGQKIFEVDFQHEGKRMEAIVSLDGEMIKVGIDD